MQESILTPDQYKDLSKKIIYAVDTRYRIIPLNSLKHPKYHLKAPIYVTLEFGQTSGSCLHSSHYAQICQ